MKSLAKTHITRLQRMVQFLEKTEEFHRKEGHELYPRSRRASDTKDAATLRHVLAWIEAQQTQQP